MPRYRTLTNDVLDSDPELVDRLIELWWAGKAILEDRATGGGAGAHLSADPDYGLGAVGRTAACLLVAQLSEMKVMADALLQVSDRPTKRALARARALGNQFYAQEYSQTLPGGAEQGRRFQDRQRSRDDPANYPELP